MTSPHSGFGLQRAFDLGLQRHLIGLGTTHVRSIFITLLDSANAHLTRALVSMIALSPLVLASPAVLAQTGSTSTFVASANCSLSAPAFCETFNQGPSAIRGRG